MALTQHLYKVSNWFFTSTFRPFEMMRNAPGVRKIYFNTVSPQGILKRHVRELATLQEVTGAYDLHFSKGGAYFELPGGAMFSIENDIPDIMSIIVTRNHENTIIKHLLSTLPRGSTIIDVGGFIGWYTVQLGLHGHHLHTFEPVKKTYTILEKNCKLNNILGQVSLNNVALSNKQGRRKMTTSNYANNHLTNKGEASVRTITLDSYSASKKIQRVDLIKIDVEGEEFNVLKGAEKTIRMHKPMIICELMDRHLKRNGHSSEMILSFLDTLGYAPVLTDERNTVFCVKKT